MRRFLFTQRKRFHIPRNLKGSGGMYVLLILGLVSGLSYLLTGGLTPNIERAPENPQFVEIEDNVTPIAQQNLQMQNIKIKPTSTPTPTPTNTPIPTRTPTPIPSATPTPTQIPSPTPTVVACLNQTVITLIVDLSSSMDSSGKIGALNEAMSSLVGSLNTNTVIGGVAFGEEGRRFGNVEGVSSLIGYTVYGGNQSRVRNALTSLNAGNTGGTFMRNGFQTAINQLQAVRSNYPGYRHVAIVFSDGVPEMLPYRNPVCLGGGYIDDVCWARQQDPRSTPSGLSGTDLTSQLEAEVETVYSVAIYNSAPGSRGVGHTQRLRTLLGTIASANNAPFFQAIDLRTGDARNLTSFFRTIVNDACS